MARGSEPAGGNHAPWVPWPCHQPRLAGRWHKSQALSPGCQGAERDSARLDEAVSPCSQLLSGSCSWLGWGFRPRYWWRRLGAAGLGLLAGLGLNCSGFGSRSRTAGTRSKAPGGVRRWWQSQTRRFPCWGPTAVLLPCTDSPRGLRAELTVHVSGPAASFASPFVSSSLWDKAVGILPLVLTGF